jgi:hypothetical protein
MRNVHPLGNFVLLAFIAATGCSEHPPEESTGTATDAAFAFDTCGPLSAGTGWQNGFFAQQSGLFSAQFAAVPLADRIDAVVGLSNGPADAFNDLAAIVRFNPSGFVDVRKGGVYAAEVSVPYRANDHFKASLEIDLVRRFYDVYLELPDGSVVDLARGYPFRTQQAGVTRLDNFGRFVEGASGSVYLCSLWGQSIHTPCTSQPAGSPWMSQSFPRQTGRFDVWFTAYVDGARAVDTVIGLSSGVPGRFTDLGPIVRFNPTGSIDVRNGGVYQTDYPQPYQPGYNYRWVFLMKVDVPSRTYSVYLQPWGRGQYDLIAKDYAFRTEQSQVTSLSHLGQFVSSASGSAHVCNVTIDYDPE